MVESEQKTMNSVVIVDHGKFDFGQIPVPTCGPNQILVKVDSAALNPSDLMFMRGLYRAPIKYPHTPGIEASGTIVAVHDSLDADKYVGKRVAFMKASEMGTYNIGGTFAEYAITYPR